ncbi:2-oxo acid dehydrogenase subunit E2 [Rhodocyclus tenuis]|uniref:2-oxo acid dehydrogenase subunit E2 n=1 Tax=Rhodocyclus tenuis TaxID=1066 RepID=UPI00190818F8|nr:2-oxo acid dehydrogenase subunit E2 [Rhodocyclus tenuis]MBK1680691.1 branched-chain alpha-keto acid dehydrogenase subunit E2 [Rhodocyclus tenuis]
MSELIEVRVPDIGDYADVPVIDVYVAVGDAIAADGALATLESDKATMDIPAPVAGIVREVLLKVGDRVAQGARVALIEAAAPAQAAPAASADAAITAAPVATSMAATAPAPATAASSSAVSTSSSPAAVTAQVSGSGPQAFVSSAATAIAPPPVEAAAAPVATHASPSVRKLARELGVDLTRVPASGPKGRILADDVTAWVKSALQAPAAAETGSPAPAAGGAGLTLAPWPQVDFAKYGPVDSVPLSRIKKMSGANLARNWVMIPAVTYHEDADITALEEFRQQINRENAKGNIKLTLLAFLIKSSVAALQRFPELNSSLDGDALILKKYYHIGFAADTPHGLVVPVIRDAGGKSLAELASEAGALADKARAGKLAPAEMSGASFTISSLGGIGGTAFSPIVNAPEVAILGVNKAAMKPVWNGETFEPRLTLPLSLSADHRVVDGALATRFLAHLAGLLADLRRLLL